MSYQKFLGLFSVSVIVIVLLNYVVWSQTTSKILPQDGSVVGDLARMSYLDEMVTNRINSSTNSNFQIQFSNSIENIDLITFGDSFSRGGGGGQDRFYQDLISNRFDIDVVNFDIGNLSVSPIEQVLLFLQTEEFEKTKPTFIMLQSVERYVIDRFGGEINWDIELNSDNYGRLFADSKFGVVPPQNFLNLANVKALIYPTLYKFNDQAYFSNAVLVELSKELFSSVSSDRLLFYVEDVKNVGKSNPDTVNEVVNNLNRLSDILEQNGIRLVFMPTVDKYNLYSRFIINNKYPESSLFETLREQQMDFSFVDTKQILALELENGIKDIYYSDDTHWSNIGSSLVVNYMDSIFR